MGFSDEYIGEAVGNRKKTEVYKIRKEKAISAGLQDGGHLPYGSLYTLLLFVLSGQTTLP